MHKMHNYYSNHAYMHGYYNMCIYYFYNLFSLLLSLSLGFGHSHLTLSFFIWSNHSSIAIDHQTTVADKSSNHADRWSSNHQTKASPIIKPHQSNHLCVLGWVGDDLAWLGFGLGGWWFGLIGFQVDWLDWLGGCWMGFAVTVAVMSDSHRARTAMGVGRCLMRKKTKSRDAWNAMKMVWFGAQIVVLEKCEKNWIWNCIVVDK